MLSNQRIFDYKYLDVNPFESVGPGYDFYPLRGFLEDVIHFPIKTSFDNDEPRFLMVSVDVQDCTTSNTFDSYPKGKDQNGNSIWYSEYGGDGDDQKRHHVDYDGIGVYEVLASSLFPFALQNTQLRDRISNTDRTFWDGNFISSTPLREVLQYHRDFWLDYFKQNNIEKKDKQKVPNLEVYIVNLYPSLEDYLPTDLDSIRDREIDIKFHDRTKYDEQMAHIVTDYITFVRSVMDIALSQAKDKRLLRDEFSRLLRTGGLRSRGRYNKPRRYQDLLERRFKVKVHRIDRHNDSNTIFGKHGDFSSTTIDELIRKGRHEAHLQIH